MSTSLKLGYATKHAFNLMDLYRNLISDTHCASVVNYHIIIDILMFSFVVIEPSKCVFQGEMYWRFTSNQWWVCVALSINNIYYLYFIGAFRPFYKKDHCTVIMKFSVLITTGCPAWRIAFKNIQQSLIFCSCLTLFLVSKFYCRWIPSWWLYWCQMVIATGYRYLS